ncbi:hypothetical protein [Streptosporangium sp. OZ121]|uniref:hypothetical protein n=1 Tax=Streptosporangium sp. OZ121 TaxID=3444183 RepID=UPI003F7AB85F
MNDVHGRTVRPVPPSHKGRYERVPGRDLSAWQAERYATLDGYRTVIFGLLTPGGDGFALTLAGGDHPAADATDLDPVAADDAADDAAASWRRTDG